jgi:DNA-binding MarR family transcriptional regulator
MQPADEITQTPRRQDFVALLFDAAEALVSELTTHMEALGYGDIREGHGCVFGNVDADGMRLTELAERAGMTKQAVGEAVSDLERLGYAERAADPSDGRAKIIRLTERGRAAQAAGFQIIGEIEDEWAERFGARRVDSMRSLLNDILAGKALLARAA